MPGVSRHFLEEVDAAVRRIADNPMQFPAVHRDIRRARLRRFPYAVFFRVADHDVQVIACFHSNRDPRRWQRRV